MKNVLVLGLGNILLSDEGIGVRVVERLCELMHLPEEVQVVDGGTLGLDLLPYVESAGRLLVIDAIDMGAAPGTLIRLEGDEVPSFWSVRLSEHQMGLADLLAVAKLRGSCPEALVVWGVQPGVTEMGLDLQPPVAEQLDVLVEKTVAEMKRWGIACEKKLDQE